MSQGEKVTVREKMTKVERKSKNIFSFDAKKCINGCRNFRKVP